MPLRTRTIIAPPRLSFFLWSSRGGLRRARWSSKKRTRPRRLRKDLGSHATHATPPSPGGKTLAQPRALAATVARLPDVACARKKFPPHSPPNSNLRGCLLRRVFYSGRVCVCRPASLSPSPRQPSPNATSSAANSLLALLPCAVKEEGKFLEMSHANISGKVFRKSFRKSFRPDRGWPTTHGR